MIKFSVIIPCYHSEKFIGKAIESVLNQSFTNYELLVMCEKGDTANISAVRDCGIEPIIDDYSSSGAARNAGIDRAEGAYILFLDSDDWIDPEMCEELYKLTDLSFRDSEIISSNYIAQKK